MPPLEESWQRSTEPFLCDLGISRIQMKKKWKYVYAVKAPEQDLVPGGYPMSMGCGDDGEGGRVMSRS